MAGRAGDVGGTGDASGDDGDATRDVGDAVRDSGDAGGAAGGAARGGGDNVYRSSLDFLTASSYTSTPVETQFTGDDTFSLEELLEQVD